MQAYNVNVRAQDRFDGPDARVTAHAIRRYAERAVRFENLPPSTMNAGDAVQTLAARGFPVEAVRSRISRSAGVGLRYGATVVSVDKRNDARRILCGTTAIREGLAEAWFERHQSA